MTNIVYGCHMLSLFNNPLLSLLWCIILITEHVYGFSTFCMVQRPHHFLPQFAGTFTGSKDHFPHDACQVTKILSHDIVDTACNLGHKNIIVASNGLLHRWYPQHSFCQSWNYGSRAPAPPGCWHQWQCTSLTVGYTRLLEGLRPLDGRRRRNHSHMRQARLQRGVVPLR